MNHEGVLPMEKESVTDLMVLSEAEGSIHAAHEQDVIETAEAIVRGEYHRLTDKVIVCKCIDGRNCQNGLEGPNSAGGTLSLLVADDLTSQRFIRSDEPVAVGMTRLTEFLHGEDYPVGIHSDTHASGDKAGCGANDMLPEIYVMMVKKAEAIRSLAQSILGKEIQDEIHSTIMERVMQRVLFGPGSKIKAAVTEVVGDEACETLEGGHKEIVAVINLIHGTTLDRDALQEATDGEYQAFNVDAWAFKPSAKIITSHDANNEINENEVEAKVIALTYYNLATALVLCGPEMLVGIRR